MRGGLLAVSVLLIPGPAWAQGQSQLEEVEVTAQRRTESVQRAAVAVSVLTPGDLRDAGVTKPQELTELVPSLQVAASAAPISVYYLRGAGNFTGAFFNRTVNVVRGHIHAPRFEDHGTKCDVAGWIATTQARGHGDFFGDLAEYPTFCSIGSRFAVLNVCPFTMSSHLIHSCLIFMRFLMFKVLNFYCFYTLFTQHI